MSTLHFEMGCWLIMHMLLREILCTTQNLWLQLYCVRQFYYKCICVSIHSNLTTAIPIWFQWVSVGKETHTQGMGTSPGHVKVFWVCTVYYCYYSVLVQYNHLVLLIKTYTVLDIRHKKDELKVNTIGMEGWKTIPLLHGLMFWVVGVA